VSDLPVPFWADGPEDHGTAEDAPCWACCGVVPEDHHSAPLCAECADVDPDALLAEVMDHQVGPYRKIAGSYFGAGEDVPDLDPFDREDSIYHLEGAPF
jgi:hypothetical protein